MHARCFPPFHLEPSRQPKIAWEFSAMNDEKLHQLLHAWKEEPELPVSFQHEVWKKIETNKAAAPAALGWLVAFLDWLAKPVPAVAACALTLGAGLLTGGMAGGKSADSKLAAYAHSIDPLSKHTTR
jgi:hypothetical protein